MTTSDPRGGQFDQAFAQSWRENLNPGIAAPIGLPDPAALSRMATEFFTDIPARDSDLLRSDLPRGVSTSAQELVLGAVAQQPSSFPGLEQASVPTESGITLGALEALPSSLALEGAIPKVPGFVMGQEVPVVPSEAVPFGFLQEARPIFAALPVTQASPERAQAEWTNTGVRVVPASDIPNLSTVLDSSAYSATGLRGVPKHLDGAEQGLGFLEKISQIPEVKSIPSAIPGSQAAATAPSSLPNLGFSSRAFEVNEIRRDFPILQERVNGRQIIWLDNAATTQKPQAVIDRLSYFYAHENSNVHRAAHELAARATDAYEAAREKVRRFLSASSSQEIVFVRGATEGINLVAKSWGWRNVNKGDEIVITWLEHHADIVPWQMLCTEKGAHLRVAPVDDRGEILLDEYQKLLNSRTRLVALPQVSNALGTVTRAREMIEMAHQYDAKVLLDGAQAVSHMPVNVQLLDCDFYVLSGHKVFAPTGIGVVYGKSDVLQQTPPWQGGGNMITDVTFEKTSYQVPPGRFEAGTGNIADAVGLGAAVDYIERLGMANIERYEHSLMQYALESLRTIPGLRLIGSPKDQAGVISFVLDGFRTEDVGGALNRDGIAVRSGHHCAQPILRRFGLESTVRASLALYNTCEEVDALVAAIWNLKQGRGPSLL